MPRRVNWHLNLIHTRPCSSKADCWLCLFCTLSIVVETRRLQQRLAIFEPMGLIILVQRIFAIGLLFVSPKSFVSTMACPENEVLDALLGAFRHGMGLSEKEFFAKFHLEILAFTKNLGLSEEAQFELVKHIVCVDSPEGPIQVKECFIPLVKQFYPTCFGVVHEAHIKKKTNGMGGARDEAKKQVDDIVLTAKLDHEQNLEGANEKIAEFVPVANRVAEQKLEGALV